MAIFDDIKNRIFGTPAASAAVANPAPAKPQSADAARDAAIAIGLAAAAQVATASAKPVAAATPVDTAPAKPVDVAAVLDAAVAKSGQKLNWKTSIVDLMKALDLDSSITARKALADELGYKGDKSDSATMNIWLHKQVIDKLVANGGTLPATRLA